MSDCFVLNAHCYHYYKLAKGQPGNLSWYTFAVWIRQVISAVVRPGNETFHKTNWRNPARIIVPSSWAARQLQFSRFLEKNGLHFASLSLCKFGRDLFTLAIHRSLICSRSSGTYAFLQRCSSAWFMSRKLWKISVLTKFVTDYIHRKVIIDDFHLPSSTAPENLCISRVTCRRLCTRHDLGGRSSMHVAPDFLTFYPRFLNLDFSGWTSWSFPVACLWFQFQCQSAESWPNLISSSPAIHVYVYIQCTSVNRSIYYF